MNKVKKLKVNNDVSDEETEVVQKKIVKKDTPELVSDILYMYASMKSACDLVERDLTNEDISFRDLIREIQNARRTMNATREFVKRLRNTPWRQAMEDHIDEWREDMNIALEKAKEMNQE